MSEKIRTAVVTVIFQDGAVHKKRFVMINKKVWKVHKFRTDRLPNPPCRNTDRIGTDCSGSEGQRWIVLGAYKITTR